MVKGCILKFLCVHGHIFSFINSGSLKISCHGLISLTSWWLQVAVLSAISTALGKNLGVRLPVILIEEFPWEVASGGIPREAISSYKEFHVVMTTY